MKNRYYTPVLSDFTMGLEFQFKQTEEVDWTTVTVGDDFFDVVNCYSEICDVKFNLRREAKQVEYRVKTLDEQDITSFGFRRVTPIAVNGATYNSYSNKKGDVLTHYDGSRDITVTIEDKHSNVLFTGIIMNRKELKDILERVSILDPYIFDKKFKSIMYAREEK